jgi:hypothetical protein
MGHEAEIEILFKTTGAAEAVEDLKAVEQGEKAVIDQSKVNIIDNSRPVGRNLTGPVEFAEPPTSGGGLAAAEQERQTAAKLAAEERKRLLREQMDAEDALARQEHDAALKKQADDDLAKVTADRQLEATKTQEQAEKNSDVNRAARAFTVGRVASHVREIAVELTRLTPAGSDARKAMESLETSIGGLDAGMQAFVYTGNPMLGVLTALAQMSGGVIKAFDEMMTSIHNADDAEKIFGKNLVDAATQHRQLVQSVRADQLAGTLGQEVDQARKLGDEFKRANDLRHAKDELAAAQANAAGVAPVDQDIAKGKAQAADFASGIRQAEANIQSLNEKLTTQTQIIANLNQDGTPLADIEKAQAARKEIADELEKATEDLATLREVDKLKLATTATDLEKKATDDAEKQLNQLGNNLIENLQQQVASGKPLDTIEKLVYDQVQKLREDGTITLKEANQLAQSANLLQGSTSSTFGDISKTIGNIMANTAAIVQAFKSRDAEIAQMKAQIEALNLRQ